jgi:hypothetical protein
MPRGSREISGHHDHHCPQRPADCVEDQESPVRHPGRPRDRRHQRPQHADPAPGQHRPPTAPGHDRLGPRPAPLADEPAQSTVHQPRAEMATHLVADRITDDRGDHGEGRQDREAQPSAAGERAGHQQDRLAGKHDTDEHRRLAEHQRGDDQVRRPGRQGRHGVYQGRHRTARLIRRRRRAGSPHRGRSGARCDRTAGRSSCAGSSRRPPRCSGRRRSSCPTRPR